MVWCLLFARRLLLELTQQRFVQRIDTGGYEQFTFQAQRLCLGKQKLSKRFHSKKEIQNGVKFEFFKMISGL